MALATQNIEIPIDGGINEKVDAKRVQPNESSDLVNWSFNKVGGLTKRPGTQYLDMSDMAGATPRKLLTVDSRLVALATQDGQHGNAWEWDGAHWNELNQSEDGVGPTIPYENFQVTLDAVTGDAGAGSLEGLSDSEHNNGVTWCATYGPSGTTIHALDDDGTLVYGPVTGFSGTSPRLVSLTNDWVALYAIDSGHLYQTIFESSTLTKSAEVVLATDPGPGLESWCDAHVGGGFAWVIYTHNAEAGFVIKKITTAGVLSATYTVAFAPHGARYFGLYYHASTARLIISVTGISVTNNDVYAMTASGSFSSVFGLTPTASSLLSQIGICVDPTNASGAILCLGDNASAYIYQLATLTTTPTSTGLFTVPHVSFATRPINASNGSAYVVMMTPWSADDAPRPVMWLARIIDTGSGVAPVSVARVNQDTAIATTDLVTSLQEPASGTFEFVAQSVLGRYANGHQSISRWRLATAAFDVGRASFGHVAYEPGGQLWALDGKQVHEAAVQAPARIASTSTSTTGGLMSNGTYSLRLAHQYTFENGEVVRGPVSDAVSVTLSGGGTTQKITLSIEDPTYHTCHMNSQSTLHRKARLYCYMTTNGGATYYIQGQVTGASGGTFPHYIGQAVTGTEPVLYTSGGYLESDPPPACSDVRYANGRMWLVLAEDKRRVWPSKIKEVGVGFEWSANLETLCPEPVTRLAVLDEKILALCERSIYFLYGSGPSNVGSGAWPDWQRVHSNVGCVDAGSVVEIPQGLMFRSHRGIHLLDRGLNPKYIGAKVEDMADSATFVTAVHDEVRQEARFGYVTFSTTRQLLVYDYDSDKWTFYLREAADGSHYLTLDACLWDGKYTWLTAFQNDVFYEDDSITYDVGTTQNNQIKGYLTTGWIHLAGIAGFQRVRRMSLIGTRIGTHGLTIQIGYDYSDTWTDTVSFSSGTLTALGDDKIRIVIPRQKCTAIRFRITEEDVNPTSDVGYSLTGMQIEVGIKKGMLKQSAPEGRA